MKTHTFEAIERYNRIKQDKKDIRRFRLARNVVLMTLLINASISYTTHLGEHKVMKTHTTFQSFTMTKEKELLIQKSVQQEEQYFSNQDYDHIEAFAKFVVNPIAFVLDNDDEYEE